MAVIRSIFIQNFRTIRHFKWDPEPGINCLIGSGDSGKSTVLEAIDACLTARRSLTFSDTDFYQLNVDNPIDIRITLGKLPDHLKDIDVYGDYLRSFDPLLSCVNDEPAAGLEIVITTQLTVAADLEPIWRLYSDRMADPANGRVLPFKDRAALAPARIGSHPSTNLSWTRGSVLNRLSDERVEMGAELVAAARDARAAFGDKAGKQLAATLAIVSATSKSLGVPVGNDVQALLDAQSVSFSNGALALHDGSGVPLRSLGTGSARLLLAGLHRAAASQAGIVLADEIEFGLEPHRLIRLLHSLGSKDEEPELQVFMTTHSPAAVRELSASQLHILRKRPDEHVVMSAGTVEDAHGAIRLYPEAMLARTVIVCEGASEVGLIRGLDFCFTSTGVLSLQAAGAALVDAKGGSPDKCLQRAVEFCKLGYRVIAFIDNDKTPTESELQALHNNGGIIATWSIGMALEDVLFQTMPAEGVEGLIDKAREFVGDAYMDENLRLSGATGITIACIEARRTDQGDYPVDHRTQLGKAARLNTKKGSRGWFKTVGKMEDVALNILGPHYKACSVEFTVVIDRIFAHCHSDVGY